MKGKKEITTSEHVNGTFRSCREKAETPGTREPCRHVVNAMLSCLLLVSLQGFRLLRLGALLGGQPCAVQLEVMLYRTG